MRINADTNLLLRYLMPEDDPEQHLAARALLDQAESIYVALPTLCELVWVLRRSYRADRDSVALVMRAIFDTEGIVYDRLSAKRGLRVLESGGDFADGAIAELGYRAGDYVFASFDTQAIEKLREQGLECVQAGG